VIFSYIGDVQLHMWIEMVLVVGVWKPPPHEGKVRLYNRCRRTLFY